MRRLPPIGRGIRLPLRTHQVPSFPAQPQLSDQDVYQTGSTTVGPSVVVGGGGLCGVLLSLCDPKVGAFLVRRGSYLWAGSLIDGAPLLGRHRRPPPTGVGGDRRTALFASAPVTVVAGDRSVPGLGWSGGQFRGPPRGCFGPEPAPCVSGDCRAASRASAPVIVVPVNRAVPVIIGPGHVHRLRSILRHVAIYRVVNKFVDHSAPPTSV